MVTFYFFFVSLVSSLLAFTTTSLAAESMSTVLASLFAVLAALSLVADLTTRQSPRARRASPGDGHRSIASVR